MSETRSGHRRSLPDLIGAMLVCLVAVAVVYGLARFQGAGGDEVDPTPEVDYSADLATARDQAPFQVLAPTRVPEGWEATSAEWETIGPVRTWQLGFLTDSEEYVGYEQSNARVSDAVGSATPAYQPGPPVTIKGVQWQTLSSEDGEHALVLAGKGVTTVVTGTVEQDVLVDFASSLTAD